MSDVISADDLKAARNYKWTAAASGDNPRVRAGTDHAKLNRNEGYEVLYFVNHYAATRELATKAQGLQVAAAIAGAQENSPNGHTHKEWREYLDKKNI